MTAEERIARWEKINERSHMGNIELNPGQYLIYYDEKFVRDIIAGYEIIAKENESMKQYLRNLKEILQ